MEVRLRRTEKLAQRRLEQFRAVKKEKAKLIEDFNAERKAWEAERLANSDLAKKLRGIADIKVGELRKAQRQLLEFKIIQEQLVKAHMQEILEMKKSKAKLLSKSKSAVTKIVQRDNNLQSMIKKKKKKNAVSSILPRAPKTNGSNNQVSCTVRHTEKSGRAVLYKKFLKKMYSTS